MLFEEFLQGMSLEKHETSQGQMTQHVLLLLLRVWIASDNLLDYNSVTWKNSSNTLLYTISDSLSVDPIYSFLHWTFLDNAYRIIVLSPLPENVSKLSEFTLPTTIDSSNVSCWLQGVFFMCPLLRLEQLELYSSDFHQLRLKMFS